MKNNNITYLRFLAIIAIVLHHSLCAFDGWPPNHGIGIELPPVFGEVSGILKTLGLGVFTFISGYLLYYQVNKNEKYLTFLSKKTKRILVPCILWATVYALFFSTFMFDTWPAPINGTHLWYLPMLFLCFIITSIDIYRKRQSHSLILIGICWCFSIVFSKVCVFRTFNELSHFLPVFITGYYFNKYNLQNFVNKRKSVRFIVLYGGVIACIVITFFKIPLVGGVLKMVTYATTSYICVSALKKSQLHYVESIISNNSFSIYLLHQFVINILLLILPFVSTFNFYCSFLILSVTALFVPIGINLLYNKIKLILWKNSIS